MGGFLCVRLGILGRRIRVLAGMGTADCMGPQGAQGTQGGMMSTLAMMRMGGMIIRCGMRRPGWCPSLGLPFLR